MKYYVRINKRARDVHVYTVLKRVGERQNALIKTLTRIFNPKGRKGANTAEKLS